MRIFLTTAIAFFCLHANAASFLDKYESYRSKDGNTQKAFEKLQGHDEGKLTKAEKALKYFALGLWGSELKKNKEAKDYLLKALNFDSENEAHIHYLLGHIYKEENAFKEATKSFENALKKNPPQNIAYLARFELSEIAIANNKPKDALTHLTRLEKQWRGTPRYPEILWKLIGVERSRNHQTLVCRWARKMYTKYPGHPLAKDWNINLMKNMYEGKPIDCLASNKDMRSRIRNLQLSGQESKARAEIEKLRSESKGSDKYETDILLVHFLESEGYPDEALQILIGYHNEYAKSFNYQIILAKTAARAGEYPTAIGAYYKAYKLSPKSKAGKEALFSGAFLSYQTRDYDGATRRFSELIKKYPGSGFARDAKWHLAWLQYLRGNYSGAEENFVKLLNEKVKVRKRRWTQPYNNDRTKYWLAMSLVRQGKNEPARTLLTDLSNDKSHSFYSIVARTRLEQLPPKEMQQARAVSSEAPASGKPSTNATVAAVTAPAAEPEEAYESPMILFSTNGEKEVIQDEAAESEEAITNAVTIDTTAPDEASGTQDETGGPQFEAVKEEKVAAEEEVETEKIQVTSFRDPRLQSRFDRAKNLIAIGHTEWAKWELYEIEKRTRNKTYLKNLMDLYTGLGFYNRANYISESFFSKERNTGGFKGARELWEYNYPRAYPAAVQEFAKKYSVPEALVLSIVKAESSFHTEAVSPVGARGLMQLMPYTANHVSRLIGEGKVDEEKLLQPPTNIKLGTRYLSRLLKNFQDQIPLVAAGYNAGPHRVHNWLRNFGMLDMDEFIEHVPFVETRNYIKKVMRNYAIYNELYSTKPISYSFLTKPVPFRVADRPSPRENWESLD